MIFVFPGQGSQYVGMGKDYLEAHEICRQTFREADDALGFHLTELIQKGPEEDLTQTANAQPAILAVSIAIYRWMKQIFQFNPQMMCGHSLGEYACLVVSGVVSFHDAIKMVRARGQFMQEAVPMGKGTMAAVLGGEDIEVERICRETSFKGYLVEPANYNCPGQLVISGTLEGVQIASERCKESGYKVIPLKVSAPFHSSMLKPAGERLLKSFQGFQWRDPQVPYVANVHASVVKSGDNLQMLLAEQVWKPVLWNQSLKKVFDMFPQAPVIELGPGKVIAGHIKKIDRNRSVVSTDTLACETVLRELEKTLS